MFSCRSPCPVVLIDLIAIGASLPTSSSVRAVRAIGAKGKVCVCGSVPILY